MYIDINKSIGGGEEGSHPQPTLSALPCIALHAEGVQRSQVIM